MKKPLSIIFKFIFILLLFSVFLACNREETIVPTDPDDQSQFQKPMVEYTVTQEFGAFNQWAGRYHCGEDLDGSPGTPVYAIADGILSYSGQILGYGWLITIDHGDPRVYSLYGHVSTRRWKKREGKVKKGELIAFLGDGDEISGILSWLEPHLHFGIRRGSRFNYPTDTTDNRWTAGFTHRYPTELHWLDPSDFLESYLEN
jgi:murein DD-endopeptidase MepM/ murein hydrolase activator NlpD